ncbi:MAG: LysR family transcriptional regulator, partial [Alphaproteobacteria bacterium]|nr:LysR family transcriptional regulator [Alphaproteobacteria bacterium]
MKSLPETALLRSFLVVAQELSFRRASDRLALDQSALSRRIQKLEGELGYALFERSTREVALTAAGVSLYRGITQNLNDCMRSIDEARRVAEGLTGRIRIGYMAFAATELMPQAVARFKSQHPDVLVEIHYIRTQAQKVPIAN